LNIHICELGHGDQVNENRKISTTLDQLKLDDDEDLDGFLGDDIEVPTIPKSRKKDDADKKKRKSKPVPVLLSDDDSSDEGRIEILADEDYEDL
jgi:hypothetical protein